jgi:hypothetical protein
VIHHRTLKAAKREVCPLAAKVGAVLKTLTRWRQDAYAEYRCAEETGKLLQMAELKRWCRCTTPAGNWSWDRQRW